MKASEIRELTVEEIQQELEHARENLFNLRFRLATSQLRDHNVLKAARRDVARLETVLRERELVGEG
jgi:large subunit ribosomal protein L29